MRQRPRTPEGRRRLDISVWAVAAAALLAVVPALAVWPKFGAGGVVLSEAMFDHSKAAIIDDIVRLGLPPGNPFFAGGGPRLVYYYLWHFSAAIPAALFGASGWEADIALTWFTAFASLCLMIGLAALFAGRRIAAFLVVFLCLSASLKPVLGWLLPAAFLDRALARGPWPESWIFQASWAPQHLAAAGCVVVAVLVLSRLAALARLADWYRCSAVVAAAGFESSAWVGGVIFAAAALPIGIAVADHRRRRPSSGRLPCQRRRWRSFLHWRSRSRSCATSISRPRRGTAGPPLAFHPFAVLGPIVPAAAPAGSEPAGLLGDPDGGRSFRRSISPVSGRLPRASERRAGRFAEDRFAVGLALLALASFAVPWLFASTIANNDLGWRGVLPGILVLTVFAAAGLARWISTAAQAWRSAAIALLGLGSSRRPADHRARTLWACRRRRRRILAARSGTVGRGAPPHGTRRTRRQQPCCSSPTACAGRSTFPGHCLPIAAPAMPAGIWRAPLCRCRARDRPDQCAVQTGVCRRRLAGGHPRSRHPLTIAA